MSDIEWFYYNGHKNNNGVALHNFITYFDFSSFKKVGLDKTGKPLIFLTDKNDVPLAAIRSENQQMHQSALNKLRSLKNE